MYCSAGARGIVMSVVIEQSHTAMLIDEAKQSKQRPSYHQVQYPGQPTPQPPLPFSVLSLSKIDIPEGTVHSRTGEQRGLTHHFHPMAVSRMPMPGLLHKRLHETRNIVTNTAEKTPCVAINLIVIAERGLSE